MSFRKRPGKNTPQCYTKPLDSIKNWNNRFFWVDERIFPTVVEWRTNTPKDKMPSADSYSAADVTTLNTYRTPIQKQPELLLCLVGLSQSYFRGDDVYPIFLYDDDRACGIVQQLTPPYTPQHNGVSEGRNRTLLDMVRSMMNLTTLPLSSWDYALESTTRILNMVPTKKVGMTPYELWYGKVPNLSYLKVWRCEALVKRDTPDKLQFYFLVITILYDGS
ncbi:gypsy type transposase [Tanacetum coccineum]